MIQYFKTIDNRLVEQDKLSSGCWINAIAPDEKDMDFLLQELELDRDFVMSSLDEEESSRIESEEDQTLVIVDLPTAEPQEDGTMSYSTMPMGIILTPDYVVTICLRPQPVISEIADGR